MTHGFICLEQNMGHLMIMLLEEKQGKISSLFCYVMWVDHNIIWTYYVQRRHLENRVSQCLNLFYLLFYNDTKIQIIELLSTWPLIQIARQVCHVLQINNFIKLTTQTVALRFQYPLLVPLLCALCLYLFDIVSFMLFLKEFFYRAHDTVFFVLFLLLYGIKVKG